MGVFDPQMRDLPDTFPVFPLPGALLLPRGKLPLNIFEPRYLAMVEDALGAGRMFGMVQPDPQRPRSGTGPAFYPVGCLGRLSSFSETDDGRYLITLTGVARFRTVREIDLRRGYRRVEADYAPFMHDLEPEPPNTAVARETLLTELRGFFARSGLEANWEAVERMPDDMLVVTLAMVCPFAPPEKQALLEAATPSDRAEALLALLRMGGRDPDDGSDRRAS
jgi:Lon protease-like protein